MGQFAAGGKLLPRAYSLVVAAVMAVGWLVVVVTWGHCHTNAGDNPGNPWYTGTLSLSPTHAPLLEKRHFLHGTVCYQAKIQDDLGDFILGVDKELGDAMVAFAALVLIAYEPVTLPSFVLQTR